MCGIAGVVGAPGEGLDAMVAAIRHRGPDHVGTFRDGPISFGHARLSILDLSAASDQPFIDAQTGCVLIYNGEIYNFRELRSSLEQKGARFETSGDTEVILQGYLHEGPNFFSRLNGIFAFALWDPRSREVLLVRDPVGVKPIVLVHLSGGGVAFASEAKALYPFLPEFKLDPIGLGSFLRFHYSVGANTIVAGIKRFRAGICQVLDQTGRVKREIPLDGSYHDPAPGPVTASRLWQELDQAVERQMIADVPVGVFLSGGIDSSIIAHCVARHAKSPVSTFSVGFDTGATDERPEAQAFAASLGTRHEALEVRGEDVARDIGTMSWHFDGPLGEGGCIPNWYVSKLAAKRVKVVLAGEGGDEVWGGYPWYAPFKRTESIAKWLPKAEIFARWASKAPYPLGPGTALLMRPGRWERYATIMEINPPARLNEAGLPVVPLGKFGRRTDPMEVDRKTLLRDCFLEKADRMTMAHGLEERVPHLDLRLLELQRRLSIKEKMGPPEKRLLREAAALHLPKGVASRAKRGYGTPMTEWAGAALADRIERSLQEPRPVELGLVDGKAWKVLASQASVRSVSSLMPSWLLFALDEWVRELQRRSVIEATQAT